MQTAYGTYEAAATGARSMYETAVVAFAVVRDLVTGPADVALEAANTSAQTTRDTAIASAATTHTAAMAAATTVRDNALAAAQIAFSTAEAAALAVYQAGVQDQTLTTAWI